MTRLAVFAALLGCALASSAAHAATTIALDRSFMLVDADGRTVSMAEFTDKFLLVYFGYMHCSDLCPTALSTMSEAMEELGPAAAYVQPLFVTVDPERDRGPVLRSFTQAFDKRLIGLGGTSQQIADIAQALGIKYEKAFLDDKDYVVDHSTTLSLIEPGGKTAVSITAAEPSLIVATIFDALARAGVRLDNVSNLAAYR